MSEQNAPTDADDCWFYPVGATDTSGYPTKKLAGRGEANKYGVHRLVYFCCYGVQGLPAGQELAHLCRRGRANPAGGVLWGCVIRVTPSQVPMPKIPPTTCVLRVCGRIASIEGFASGPHQPVSGSGAGRCSLSPWVVVLAAWVALDLTPPEGLGWLLRQDSLTSC
jgi:hypothetical protein